MQEARNHQLDAIRAVAILLVMFGHAIIIYDPAWRYFHSTVEAPVCVWLKQHVINLVQMPLFFALAGYLHSRQMGRKAFGPFAVGKLKRLGIPFFFVGLCIMLPIKVALGVPFHAEQGLGEMLLSFLLGRNCVGHLWFLPSLLLVYLLAKMALTTHRNVTRDVIVFSCLVLMATFIPAKWVWRIPYLLQVITYAPYFYLGFLVAEYDWDKTGIFCRLGLVALGALLAAGAAWGGLNFPVLPSLAATFAFFALMPNVYHPLIRRISADSFGLYLFHSPLIYFAFTMMPNVEPGWMILVNFIGCGLLAWGLTALMRRLHLRMLIGE